MPRHDVRLRRLAPRPTIADGDEEAARIETVIARGHYHERRRVQRSGAVFSTVIGRKKNATARAKPVISSRPVPCRRAVALELALAPEVVRRAPSPEVVDAKGGEDQQRR